MSYQYHVFLSYRRYGEWPQWVKLIFLPLFKHWLGEELGEEAHVFFDQEIEKGSAWPYELAGALAHARVLVPLWSRQYFNSDWCKSELAHMFIREKQFEFRTAKRPGGLIVPALIHDGDDIPHYAQGITPALLQDCANVRVAKNSRTEEELSARIRGWAPDIVKAIRHAPRYDPQWEEVAVDEMLDLFSVPPPRQGNPPSLG